MKMTKIVLMSALASCALISGCKDDKPSNVTIEFMHSSVEQERQAVITKLIEKFEKENPTITVKQVPVEEDAYNTKVITLARTGALPEVIEVSHDYAKVMDKEQLLDRDAIGEAIKAVGEDTFYDGILRVVRTEDGTAWTGVPVSAWLSGVWYHKDILAAAGIEEPHNWEQLLQASQKLNDPGKKHYGIALPTAESVMTEQAFSQFALSGGANVFDAKGDVEIDTPEMTKALAFYKALAATTMPGSNAVMEIKDAFMNGSAPMPERFTPQQCAANLAFYEPRTIHDSSLSKAIHGIVTARCGDTEGAYVLWRDGVAIDLGDDPHSSDDGIHAAATGAIWSGVIQGFAGVQIVEGELHLAPKLPAHWRKLSFPLRWRNAQMRFCFEHDALTVESSAPVTLTLWGKTLNVSGLQIFARKDFLAPIIGTATTEGRYDA